MMRRHTVKAVMKICLALACVALVYQAERAIFRYDTAQLQSLKQLGRKLVRLPADTAHSTPSPNAPLSQTEIGQRFERRLHTLRQACHKYHNSSLFRPVGPVERVFGPYRPVMNKTAKYCSIYKCASSTWSKFIGSIKQNMKKRHIPQKNALSSMDEQVRFVFVREPYGRLLSAYTDKVVFGVTYIYRPMAIYMVKTFRANPSKKSLRCGHDVTFPEFIRYVIHSQETGIHRDPHFIPTHDHCDLCSEAYDHVGHLETLKEDMPYLLNLMQSPLNYTKTYDEETIRAGSAWVLTKVADRIKACLTMHEALSKLWTRWQTRGLISIRDPFPLTPRQAEGVTYDSFLDLSLQALARAGPKSERRQQQTDALREAFASVPMKDRIKLRKILFLDFELFGFDPSPETVFPRNSPNTVNNTFSLFNGHAQ